MLCNLNEEERMLLIGNLKAIWESNKLPEVQSSEGGSCRGVMSCSIRDMRDMRNKRNKIKAAEKERNRVKKWKEGKETKDRKYPI